ncbi:MAG: hypothetical protein JXD23_15370 [Spirochaetales bacterium]|nr:hypothetical protein [Spirochaetales bacterium]
MDRKKLILPISMVSILAAAAAAFIAWRLFSPNDPTPLRELLSQTDELASRSYPAETKAALERAYRAAASPEDFVRVLKRSYSLAVREQEYGELEKYSLGAFARFPGRADLCRIALYACLRDGDPGKALSLARGFESLPEVQALVAEILLGNGVPPADSALAALPDYARYASLDAERDPERFLTAGRELGDDRFYLDAALLYMGEGKAEEASAAARRFLLALEFDEPAGLFAYEASDTAEAVDRLTRASGRSEKRPDLYLILGDCLLEGRQPERAAVFYEQALETNRAYSVVPFLNLACTARRQGLDEKALALLREADTRFPGDSFAVIELVRLLYSRGEKTDAIRILNGYLAAHPDQFEARFLKLRFEEDASSFDRRLLRLKDLYFEDPKNERAAAALTAGLITDQDLAGARAVLTHFGEVNGPAEEGWLATARGVLVAVGGDLNGAVLRFGKAVSLEERWEHRYNRAAVLLSMGKLGEARADLAQALVDLKARKSAQQRRGEALVRAQLAAVLLKMGSPAAAEREVRAALSLDPSNERAYRVKRALEEGAGR